jgi:hypothetical protein
MTIAGLGKSGNRYVLPKAAKTENNVPLETQKPILSEAQVNLEEQIDELRARKEIQIYME